MKSIREQRELVSWTICDDLRDLLNAHKELMEWAERTRFYLEAHLSVMEDRGMADTRLFRDLQWLLQELPG